jgi:hypothetical protein
VSTGGKKRTRLDRVASLELRPGKFQNALKQLRQRDMLVRIGLCLLCALSLWGVSGSWALPFGYRTGDVPARDILASVAFREPNPTATEAARQRARDEARYVYLQDPEPLVQLRAKLRNSVVAVISAATYADVDKAIWKQFDAPLTESPAAPPRENNEEEQFEAFRATLMNDRELVKFQQALAAAMAPFERRGLLDKLPPEHSNKGNQKEILVRLVNQPPEKPLEVVQVEDVLIGAICGENGPLQQRLAEQLAAKELHTRVFNWLRPLLVSTLKLDPEGTAQERQRAAEAVKEEETHFQPGHVLVRAGHQIGPDEMRLLQLEYKFRQAQTTWDQTLLRSAAMLLLILALFVPCGHHIVRHDRSLVANFRRFSILLAILVITAGLARWLADDAWRAEIIPLLLFGMVTAIAYSRELALLLTASLSVVMVLAVGHDLQELLLILGVVCTAVLLLSNIRSRSKLIRVGVVTGLVSFVLTMVIGLTEDRPQNWLTLWQLLTEAGRTALWTLLVGFLITGLLPFIERLFGVLTDISLLELGDAAHPLLQELVRRAPGTYNHSINVASLAEAAAESIGARGLLVRVGAYFHDIGKMLKPGYFVENQGLEANRHDSLMPAMSTLIIIAHIKDGADLARQHHLPQPIIDFIEQHHGTTLVEYFFRRANEQNEDPDKTEIPESAFRYPGPKPQTREAAVLMLADAAESASRALVEPTPARLEGLVGDIAMKRLLDGQFDECDMTLEEIRTVQDSLAKSLIAVYHGRIKYPDQRTA